MASIFVNLYTLLMLHSFIRCQAWFWPAHIFGLLSLAWQIYILYRAVAAKNLEDIWINITCLMWLFGHFWWMNGDLHDTQYPNEPSIYDRRTLETGYIFIVASVWIGVYYVCLKPFLLWRSARSNILSSTYPSGQASVGRHHWRFPFYFHSWREYENIHCLFWILKDTGWNWQVNYEAKP